MTVVLRRRVGDVYVVVERKDDATWTIEVVAEAFQQEVTEAERKAALQAVLSELSSLRQHVWEELKKLP